MEEMTMIKIPKSLHKEIKIQAARAGLKMYEYLNLIVKKDIENEAANK